MTQIEKELYKKYFDFNRDLNKSKKKPFDEKRFLESVKKVGKILEEEEKYVESLSKIF